jgi:hypothetical protein
MQLQRVQHHIKLILLMVFTSLLVFVTQVALNREDGDYFEIDNITRTSFEVTFKNTANDSSYARSFVWGASGFGNQVSV